MFKKKVLLPHLKKSRRKRLILLQIAIRKTHIRHIFTHFTLHPTLSLHIYIARAEYFLIPDDAVDRRKLGF